LIWDHNKVVVSSVQELDAMLERLTDEAERDMPFMVALAREDGSGLSIGVGRPVSVLSYISASLDPPYFNSRGDDTREEPVEFLSGGEMTEFPPSSAIPTEAAREAMRYFFETGELSPHVAWEET
jgi:hypothetical protein